MDILEKLSPDTRAKFEALMQAKRKSARWLPNPGPQQMAYESKADILYYGGAAGGGKRLRIDEAIPTPHGWTTMGALAPGDAVFDKDGTPCRVTAISEIAPEPDAYTITFDNGDTIEADADHQWLTFTASELAQLSRRDDAYRARRRETRQRRGSGARPDLSRRNTASPTATQPQPAGGVRTTREIMDTLTTNSGRANHAIPIAGALDLPDVRLPVAPYLLGAWLGDGSSTKAEITSFDPEILLEFAAGGYDVTRRGSIGHGIKPGFLVVLREIGVLGNKHIPPAYLRASVGQRTALLQGLMDTDGHCRKNGGCEFTTTSPALRDGFIDLACGLGLKIGVREGRATLNGKDCGPKWRICFSAPFPVFRLPRKAARQNTGVRRTTRFLYIKSVEPCTPTPMRCIAVDSPSRTYLAGRRMVVTHNTDLMIGLALNEHEASRIYRKQSVDLRGIEKRLVEILGGRDNYNRSDKVYRSGKIDLELSHMSNPGDEENYQGRARDLHCFDEAVHFTEHEVSFVLGWMRSASGRRCRAILGSNPPTSADGEWIIKWFAPWIDDGWQGDKPAPGELMWAIHDSGEVHWVGRGDGHPGAFRVIGDEAEFVCTKEHFDALSEGDKYGLFVPRSYTFVPAKLGDNPDLKDTDYRTTIMALPEPLRSKMLYGDFTIGGEDHPFQVIPTDWVKAAQERWDPQGNRGIKMTSLGVDVAQGGPDKTVFAPRFDWWFGEPKIFKGVETPDGNAVFSLIAPELQDGAQVNIDTGGGWGNHAYSLLKDAGVPVTGMLGSGGSLLNDRSGLLFFLNKRAEWWWGLREALDPKLGAGLALPPGREVLADLVAPRWEAPKNHSGKIRIETKPDIIARLGRSPDIGDAIVYAYAKEQPVNQRPERGNARRVVGARTQRRSR